MFRPTSVVGVEVSDHVVRVVQLVRKGSRTLVRRSGSRPVPVDKRDPAINQDTLTMVLAELVQELGLGGQPAWAAVSAAAINTLNLPVLTRKELREAVGWELSRHLTFSLDGAHLSWFVKGRIGEDRQAVVASASPRKAVSRLSRVVSDAGLATSGVTPRAFALARLYRGQVPEGERVALVHFGYVSTSLVVVGSDGLDFHREIGVGLADILRSMTRQIFSEAGTIDLSLAEAEDVAARFRIGQEGAVEGPQGQELEPAQLLAMVRPDLEKLRSELERSLEFYGQSAGQDVDRIHLSGGGLVLDGLREFLANDQALHAPVEVVPVLGQLETGGEPLAPDLAVAAGAALACLEGEPVNYLPGNLHLRRPLLLFKIGGVLLPLVLACQFSFHSWMIRDLVVATEGLLAGMARLEQEVQPLVAQARKAEAQRAEVAGRVAHLESTVGSLTYPPVEQVLMELSRLVPEGVYLEEVDVDGFSLNMVVILGDAAANAERRQYLADALESSPMFDQIGMEPLSRSSSQTSRIAAEGGVYQFRARILPWRSAAAYGSSE